MDNNEIYRSLSINSINEENKMDIYNRNFYTFLYEKSDKVWVNGELIESQVERLMLKLTNGKGEPNIKTYKASNTIGGLPLTESDFINSERIKLGKLNSDELELIKRKKIAIYKELLSEKTKEPCEPNDVIIQEPKNPHNNIFVNGYAYEMFLEWHLKHKDNERNHKANYSFLIRRMIEDKLIHDVKQNSYLEFLRQFDVNIDKLKRLSECETKDKNTIYLDTKSAINTRYNITG